VSAESRIEKGTEFLPQFDRDGLVPAIAQDFKTGQVLMVGYMNRQALQETIRTGYGTYYSRSRGELWKKGQQSGHTQRVRQILIDCDQDCILLKVEVDAGQCHVGYYSCFYRAVKTDKGLHKLEFIADKSYNPEEVYQ